MLIGILIYLSIGAAVNGLMVEEKESEANNLRYLIILALVMVLWFFMIFSYTGQLFKECIKPKG